MRAVSLLATWTRLTWDRKSEYMRCRRIITGETKSVNISVDLLRRAFAESSALQSELPIGMSRAFQILNERDGEFVEAVGSGNTLQEKKQ